MAGEFCPNCGAGRIGALRFCRSCGFDFDTLTTAEVPIAASPPQAPTNASSWTSTPPPSPAPVVSSVTTPPVEAKRSPLLIVGGGLLLVIAVVAVALAMNGSRGPGSTAAGPTATTRPTPTITPRPATPRPATPRPATPTPAAPLVTPPPDDSTGTYVPGDTVTITSNGDPYLDILVDKVSSHTKYEGGYFDDTPDVKGNVFIQARITYTSLQNGATYNPFDWDVFVDDVAVDDYTFVSNGPEPDLGSGELPEGRTAQGWLVYEVPSAGRVVLSYRANMFTNDAPVFEVVLREK